MSVTVAAVDLGATSGRVLTGTLRERKLTLHECARFPNGPVPLPRERGQDLVWDLPYLWQHIVEGVRSAAAASPIDSIGIDSWAVDYGLLDSNGRLLASPAAYRSDRTTDAVSAILDAVDRRWLYKANGLQLQPFNTIFQLLADRDDPRSAGAQRMLLVPDLIGYWLTGRQRCEITNASTTGLLDPQTREWNRRVVALLAERFAINVPALLPPLIEPGAITGAVQIAGLSLRTSTGAPTPLIAVGSHDTASAVVAVPAAGTVVAGAGASAGENPHEWAAEAERGPRFAYISAGTWSLVGVELPRPVLCTAAQRANFTNELGVDGSVRFLKNVMGSWMAEQCLEQWRTRTPQPSWAVLDAETGAAPALRTLIDVDDPCFAAPGDMPALLDAAARRSGEPVPRNRGEYLRAITDSLVLANRRALRAVAQISGVTPTQINIVGGGSRNTLLCQLTADATGLPVIAGPVEATAIGNMLVQLRSIGALTGNLPELRSVVATSFTTKLYEPSRSGPERWAQAADRLERGASVVA